MTVWEKPKFTEVAMNAEIGAYQDESDYGNVPVIESEVVSETDAE
jgi:hypothetical protein